MSTSREQAVARLEAELGHPLPDDYRRFLLAGPWPQLSASDECLPENPMTAVLLSLRDVEARGPVEVLSADRDGLPDWFLPIAEAFGQEFGVGLFGGHRGRVYQWDHNVCSGPPDWTGMRLLAGSFDEFVGSLRSQESQWSG